MLKPVYSKKPSPSRKSAAAKAAAGDFSLLLPERLAVGALIHLGVSLVGAHQDTVQGAVVLGVAVIGALLNGAGDALVGVAVHTHVLLFFWDARLLCADFRKSYTQLHFANFCGMLFIT